MPIRSPKTAHFTLPLVILTLLPIILLWRVVFLGEAFLPADLLADIAPWRHPGAAEACPWNPLLWDGIAQFYPWRLFAAASFHHGYIPLWNPHEFCGTPFVANSQSAVFYPLNLLFWIMPVTRAFGVSVIVHLALTGMLLYGFLRSRAIGVGSAPALLGAVTWQLCAWQVSWLALPTFLCVSTWLPLALWLAWRLREAPSPGRTAALGACLGTMLLAGHLQIALYSLLLVSAYALYQLWDLRAARTHAIRYVAAMACGFALMIAWASPQLLPSVELAHMSHRSGATASWDGFQGYMKLALAPVHLALLVLPQFLGNPTAGTYQGWTYNGSNYAETAGYIGILGLGLAALAAFGLWRENRTVRFFAAAAGIGLLMAYKTPFDAILYFLIPGYSQSGSPGRVLVVWSLCASILTAFAAERLLTARIGGERDKFAVKAVTALFVVSIALLSASAVWLKFEAPAFLSWIAENEGNSWRVPAAILLGAGAAYALWRKGSLSTAAFGYGLAGLAAIDLLAAGLGYNHTTPERSVYPVTGAIAFLQSHAGDDRVQPLNQYWSFNPAKPPAAVLPPNACTVYGLLDTQGYDSLFTAQYMNFAFQMDGQKPPAPAENGNMVFVYGIGSEQANRADARWLVSAAPLPTTAGLAPAYQDADATVYENMNARPRATVFGRLACTAHIANQEVAPTRLTVTLKPAMANGQVDKGVDIADQWYPGWTATVDGAPAAIEKDDSIFRRVTWNSPAPPGPATVQLRYEPTSYRLGLYALCLALAITTAAGTAALRGATSQQKT